MPSKWKLLTVDKTIRGKKSGPKVPAKFTARSSPGQCAPVAVKPFPIAGPGTSAGGLAALEKFRSPVPPNCGMPFIVVTHRHPGHVRWLPELPGKGTRRPVRPAADGRAVEPVSAGRSPGKASRRQRTEAAA